MMRLRWWQAIPVALMLAVWGILHCLPGGMFYRPSGWRVAIILGTLFYLALVTTL